MKKLGLRNVILVSLSAALLNLSFVLAQPAQPPASGALTPNFTGLNVSGTTDIGDLNVDGDVQVNGELNAGMGIITGQAELGSLSINTINSINNNSITALKPIEVSQLETDTIISKDDSGEPVRIDDDLYVEDRLQVNSDSFLRNTNINGILKTNTIQKNSGSEISVTSPISFGQSAEFDNQLKVNSISANTSDGQSAILMYSDSYIQIGRNAVVPGTLITDFIEAEVPNGEITVDSPMNITGRLELNGTNIFSAIRNRISVVRGTKSQSRVTYATCPRGQIAISCGNDTNSFSSRVVESFRATTNGNPSDRSCRTVWASGSYTQGSVAICFDY